MTPRRPRLLPLLLPLSLRRTAWAQPPAATADNLNPLPFQASPEYDLYNQAEAVQFFEEKFYTDNRNYLDDEQLSQVDTLRQYAYENPVLALAAAQVLYMFAWFTASGQVLRENVAMAAELFERSIVFSGCTADREEGAVATANAPGGAQAALSWGDNACDIRWMHASLLYNWLGETDDDAARGQAYVNKANELTRMLATAPRYGSVPDAKSWTSPKHINFNSILFSESPARPIWPTDSVPMGKFLEDSHPIFKAELDAILADPRDLFNVLMQQDPSREHLGTPGGWDTVRIVRYHHWFDLFCEMAPRTCELVRNRPEIGQCEYMNVNIVRLHPGASLKPHFGNGPRLTAHLTLSAPEPLRAAMTVGTERMLWQEGKVILFDDTFPHMVSHWGEQLRYVMLVWFCHPCDRKTPHGQVCPQRS